MNNTCTFVNFDPLTQLHCSISDESHLHIIRIDVLALKCGNLINPFSS